MIKLYKMIENQFNYAECWVDDDIATVHTGIAGTTGECYEEDCFDEKAYLKAFEQKYTRLGYSAIPDEKMYWITVKWQIDSLNLTNEDEQTLNIAYDSLNEAFGWLGIGYVDGFDVGREKDGKFYITLFCLSIDKALGEETARHSVELKNDFVVDGYAFK